MKRKYEGRVQFVGVYVREAHPKGGWEMPGWSEFTDPATFGERKEVAAHCSTKLEFDFPICVDTMDDATAIRWSGWPERLFVISEEGRVVYTGEMGPFGFHPSVAYPGFNGRKAGQCMETFLDAYLASNARTEADADADTDAEAEAATDRARWARWRGPTMDGRVPAGDPPIRWSERENVRFKVRVPGLGSGTPIVWGDTMYLMTAIPVAAGGETGQKLEEWQESGREIFQGEGYRTSEEVQQFALVALDRHTGTTKWTKVLRTAQPHEGIHPTNSWASGSPVTDGEHVVCFFGSQGLFVTDMDGRLVWEKDLGDLETRKGWGEGATPALHGNTIVVPFDHEGPSFLIALDKSTGDEKWRVARDEVTSWFTPLVVERDGRAQVITTGAERVRSYDLETGEIVWHGPGLTVNAIPTPIESGGVVYVTSGFRGEAMYAVDLARARGDIEETDAILWQYPNDTPYVASPLLYDDTLYFFKGLKGVLTALDVRTGKPRFGPVRVPGISLVYASPVGTAGRVYAPGREGTTVVFEHGDAFEVLATNELDDTFDASPVVVGDTLYLRGREFLYALASDSSEAAAPGSSETKPDQNGKNTGTSATSSASSRTVSGVPARR